MTTRILAFLRAGPSTALCALILAAAVLFAAGCSTPIRQAGEDGRVVIVYSADRESDALTARDNLRALGFRVHSEPEGPAVRTSSVVAVYDIGRHEGRVTAVEEALATIPGIETRPFYLPGPEGTDVVLWLVSRERDAAAAAATPGAAPAPVAPTDSR